jgi:ketopantoate reductase
MKKIAVIGIGGRTGTMFAFELRNSAEILGIGREKEIEMIKERELYIERKGGKPEKFKEKVIGEKEFNKEPAPDFIFLCVKNPIGSVVKYYYQKFKESEKIPSLILSQNGISAFEDAKKELEEIFGEASKEIRIIRVSLFNPISSERINDEITISYFLPIRLAFGLTSGSKETEDIKEIFKTANIKAQEILSENIKNMEYSKLFLNLIGMAAAVRGLGIGEGLAKKEIFEEEIKALREYIKVVKKSGGKFLNFNHYPIKLFTILINFLPLSILKIFRKTIAKVITEKRGGKEKGNVDEIEYYNGAVIKLGEKFKSEIPINKKIYHYVHHQVMNT